MTSSATRPRGETAALRGFININKPQGITSFDVVRRIRRAAGTRKVGHAGTLDPNATGVLPIALGEATKLVDELVGTRKRYHATIALGVATETYDSDGSVTAEADASAVTREAVEAALRGFAGEIMQTPPAYSAVKREGVAAYKAARRGEPHELEPRPVVVYALDVVEMRDGGTPRPLVILDVECGKGFYVRSLAHDLGQQLGVGGHLADLCRTAVGPFRVEEATDLDTAVELLEAGEYEALVHAPDIVLLHWPAVILGRRQVTDVRQGRDVIAKPPPGRALRERVSEARAYGPDGQLVALVRPSAIAGAWHPFRVFPVDTPSQ